jgi:hypothetical protein
MSSGSKCKFDIDFGRIPILSPYLSPRICYILQEYYITMPIRNPFAKRADIQTGLQPPSEDYVRPLSQNGIRPTFEKVDTIGSKASSAMSIKSGKSQEPAEYKMSGMCGKLYERALG